MQTERTDAHRPSAIIPADYEFVGFDYYGPAIGVPIDKKTINAHITRTGGDYVQINHAGTCDVCGAHAHYVCVFYHALTNAYIVTGEDCAVKMNLSHGNMNAFRKQIGLARVMVAGQRKAVTFLGDNNIARAYEIWETDYTKLPTVPASVGPVAERASSPQVPYEEITIRSIVSKLIRYGSISEAQVKFVASLITKIDQRPILEAARKAEYEAAGEVPTGKQTVSGVVLAVKTTEDNPTYFYGDSGIRTKILIQLENGSKVYGNRFDNLEKGDKVQFSATFTASKDDVKFGFYKRAKTVATECSNPEHSHPSLYKDE